MAGCSRRPSSEPGGEALRRWIDECPNQLYSVLTFQGGKAWRKRLTDDLGDQGPVSALLERRSDEQPAQLMGNLGGHDLPSLVDAFEAARQHDRPVCFIAYTIKGFGLAARRPQGQPCRADDAGAGRGSARPPPCPPRP